MKLSRPCRKVKAGISFHEDALVLGDGGQTRARQRSIDEMNAGKAPDVDLHRLDLNGAVFQHHPG